MADRIATISVEQDDGIWIVSWDDHKAGAMFGSEKEAREHAEWLTAISKMAALIPNSKILPTGRDVEDLELVMPGIGTIDLGGFTQEVTP